MSKDEEAFTPRKAMGRVIWAPPCHHLQCRCLPWSESVISSPTSDSKSVGVQSPSQRPHPLKGEITKLSSVCLSFSWLHLQQHCDISPVFLSCFGPCSSHRTRMILWVLPCGCIHDSKVSKSFPN